MHPVAFVSQRVQVTVGAVPVLNEFALQAVQADALVQVKQFEGHDEQTGAVAVPLLKYPIVLQPIHFPSVVAEPFEQVKQPVNEVEHILQTPDIKTRLIKAVFSQSVHLSSEF